jgi:thiosulfate/3-mercaptopyruvate sulfurtransferase
MTVPIWQRPVTRRGLVVGAGTVAVAIAGRSRATHLTPLTVQADRGLTGDPLLISAQSLRDTLAPDPRSIQLLDASDLAGYRSRHIAGARHVWWQDTMELNAFWYGMVLKADDDAGHQGRRLDFLRHLGIDSNLSVVVYDDSQGNAAARVCWFLTFLGLSASVLDGGLRAWAGAGQKLTSDAPPTDQSAQSTVAPQEGFYLFADQIASRASAGAGQLVDCRTAKERTTGDLQDLAIPGALTLDRDQLLDSNDLLKDRAALSTLFSAAGIDLARTQYLIGPTAIDCSLLWLGLRLCGATTVTLCDGGWGQWRDTPGLPLERTPGH